MKRPTNNELLKALTGVTAGAEDEARRLRALRSSLRALREGEITPVGGWNLWPWLAAATCVALLIVWGLMPMKPTADQYAVIMDEMERLFPSQLDSVTIDGPNVILQTSNEPTPSAKDQRICLTISRSAQTIRVLTYSGCEVKLLLGGREMVLTPLLRGDGSVFVLTDSSVIEQAMSLPTGHHIEMRQLKEAQS